MQNKKELRSQMIEMITQWQKSGLKQKTFCNSSITTIASGGDGGYCF